MSLSKPSRPPVHNFVLMKDPEFPMTLDEDCQATDHPTSMTDTCKYLGLDGTKEDFMDFMNSALVLEYTAIAFAKNKKKLSNRELLGGQKILAQMANLSTGEREEFFGSCMKDASERYGPDSARWNEGMNFTACLLYWADKDAQRYHKERVAVASGNVTSSETADEPGTVVKPLVDYQTAYKHFVEVFPQTSVSRLTAEQGDNCNGLPPGLLSTFTATQGECDQDRYNRWRLVFLHRMRDEGASRFKKFWGPTLKNNPKILKDAVRKTPRWWGKAQAAFKDVNAAATSLGKQISAYQPRQINDIECTLKLQSRSKELEQHLETLNDKLGEDYELYDNPDWEKVISHPCSFKSLETWRNELRGMLKCILYEVNIGSIKLMREIKDRDSTKTTKKRQAIYGDMANVTFNQLLDLLNTEGVVKATFTCELRIDARVHLEVPPPFDDSLRGIMPISSDGTVLTREEQIVQTMGAQPEDEVTLPLPLPSEDRIAVDDPDVASMLMDITPLPAFPVGQAEDDTLEARFAQLHTKVTSLRMKAQQDNKVDAFARSTYVEALAALYGGGTGYNLMMNDQLRGKLNRPQLRKPKINAEAAQAMAALEAQKKREFEDRLRKDGFDTMLSLALEQRQSHPLEKPVHSDSKLNQFMTPKDLLLRDERDEARFIEQEYGGIDAVNSFRGRLEWIRDTLEHAVPGRVTPASAGTSDADRVWDKFNKEHHKMAQESDLDPENAARTVDLGEAVLGGSDLRGPRVDLCVKLLGMVPNGTHRDSETNIPKFKCGSMPNIKVDFLPNQVTGLVHMMYRSLGHFPLPEAQETGPDAASYRQILEQLKYDCPAVGGGFLVDSSGMGKTYTALSFCNWWALHRKHVVVDKDGKTQPDHRPILLVVPDGHVLRQWANEINAKFPDLNLVIAKSGDDIQSEVKNMPTRWHHVRAEHIKDVPFPQWPAPLPQMFDPTNPYASKTVLLTSYSTMKHRTTVAQKIELEKDDKGVEKLAKVQAWDEIRADSKVFRFVVGRWAKVFGLAIWDEGHLIRSDSAQVHWMARKMKAGVNWILSATPTVNNASDLPNQAFLLWDGIVNRFAGEDWLEHYMGRKKELEGDGNARIWDLYDEIEKDCAGDPTDVRRLFLLNGPLLGRLFCSQDYAALAKYMPMIDQLMTLRRSGASKLPNGPREEDVLSLEAIMPKYRCDTVNLRFPEKTEEYRESLWHHFRAAKEYAKIVQEAQGKPPTPSDFRLNLKDGVPPMVMGPLKEMAFCAASTRLARFAYLLENKFEMNYKVESIANWRQHGLSADMVLEMTGYKVRPEVGKRPSRRERLMALAERNPKIMETLRYIKEYVLPKENDPNQRFQKLLITEEYPLIAWYWELVLNFLHIPTQVIHSALGERDRSRVVTQFNETPQAHDINHLTVCILMYTINAAGVNLDKDCNRVIVNTAACNAATEIQAWSRVIRVSQKQPVQVTRFLVDNSHDLWRDSCQANKALVDLAGRGHSADTMKYMLSLINNIGRERATVVQGGVVGRQLLKLMSDKEGRKTKKMLNDKDKKDESYKWVYEFDKEGEVEEVMSKLQVDSNHSQAKVLLEMEVEVRAEKELRAAKAAADLEAQLEELEQQARQEEAALLAPGNVDPAQTSGEGADGVEDETAAVTGNDAADASDDDDIDIPGVAVHAIQNAMYGDGAEDDGDDADEEEQVAAARDVITNRAAKNRATAELARLKKHGEEKRGTMGGEDDEWEELDQVEKGDKLTLTLLDADSMNGAWNEYWKQFKASSKKKGVAVPYEILDASFLVTVKTDHDYTAEDLQKNPAMFEWGLRLLNEQRFGQRKNISRLNPYIDYSALEGYQDTITKALSLQGRHRGEEAMRYTLGKQTIEKTEAHLKEGRAARTRKNEEKAERQAKAAERTAARREAKMANKKQKKQAMSEEMVGYGDEDVDPILHTRNDRLSSGRQAGAVRTAMLDMVERRVVVGMEELGNAMAEWRTLAEGEL
ncbi:hypothetical protein LTR81_009407 [Elasticomyces elasticus]